MSDSFSSTDRSARPVPTSEPSGWLRRRLVLSLAVLAGALAMLLVPALASADTSSTLTVVGTSDVSDSGLMPNVVQQDFAKEFPQYTFKYVGSATGVAIDNAESGNGGPSALIVHAASLENQFVAGGYSYNNQYGSAIFTNNFVLAGPSGDPAGVGSAGAHNIAQAFASVAAAGMAGKDTFYTRGGTTTASGTTVEEHAIWQLVDSSGLAPAGLVLCDVSTADGGGMSPISSTVQATSGQACPDSGTVDGADAPSWYFVNAGSSQGANVIATNACTGHPANTCYVLTDDGTYDYLSSGTDSAQPTGIPSLTVLSSDNSASAPGGQYELTNYFHVYIINPSKPNETVNLPAAQDFVSLLTSQAFQSTLKDYLPNGFGGPPFTADASPLIKVSGFPKKTYNAAKKLTVKGTVTNAEPGYPALAKQPVNVDEVVGTTVIPVASGKTSSTGAYSISFTPPATGSYEVSTPQLSQIENASLSPVYGDILSPSSSGAAKFTVDSAVTSLRVKSEGGKAVVLGTVSPGTGHAKGTVTIYDRTSSKGKYRKVGTDRLGSSDANFASTLNLKPGAYQFEVKFADGKVVKGSTSKAVKATVGAKPSTAVTVKSVKVNKGSLTLSGTAKPATSGKVEVLGLRTSGTSARFTEIGKATIKKGHASFTIKGKLKRGYRYVLQLEYLVKGQTTSYSGLKTVKVS